MAHLVASSGLRRDIGPRREPAEEEWRREESEAEVGSCGRGAVGGGCGGGMGEGSGLIVTEEWPLSVEELVTELTRETLSFPAIVTTRQGSRREEPCPGGGTMVEAAG